MVTTANWTWQEGEDLVMSLVYNEGPLGAETPVDLTGYQLRMDVVKDGTRVFTFNSDDITPIDAQVDVVGPADNEATLGADGSINIKVPRSLTLPGGAVAALFVGTDESLLLNYDAFLRATTGLQSKIIRGTITVERSYTLWE
jgi:hypothetical protein